MIDTRPPEVETRATVGHWEGDLINGATKTGNLVTLVERKTRFMLVDRTDTKEAEEIAKMIAKYEVVEDLFMVTGEVDIILKARFENYKALKTFILDLNTVQGIKETKTMTIVTPFKEGGTLLFSK